MSHNTAQSRIHAAVAVMEWIVVRNDAKEKEKGNEKDNDERIGCLKPSWYVSHLVFGALLFADVSSARARTEISRGR